MPIFILNVDDMLVVGTKIEEIASLKPKLNASFDMKDLGNANHILGMRIVQNREKNALFLSHSKYIGKGLMHFNMEGGKVWSIPLPSYLKLSLGDCPKFDAKRANMAKVPYCFAIVCLMYAMICTRLDIAYVVVVVNRYMYRSIGKQWRVS